MEEPSQLFKEEKEEKQWQFSESQPSSNVDDSQETVIGGIKLKGSKGSKGLQELLSESFPKIESVKDEDIVWVIGNTGAGKSTFVNYMLGCKFEKKTNKFGKSYAAPQDKVFAEIGESFRSKTVSPEAYKGNDKLVFCDCPGFIDTRTKEERICISINTQIAVSWAKSIRAILVVIDYDSFFTDRGTSFRKLSETIGQLLTNPQEIPQSLFFVITKASRKVTNQNIIASISAITQEEEGRRDTLNSYAKSTWGYVSDKMNWSSPEVEKDVKKFEECQATLRILKLIQNNSKNVILCNVFDNGQSKDEIVKLLKTSKIINRSDTRNYFNFAKYDDVRVKFNHLVFKIAHEGADIISKKIELPDHILRCKSDIEETQTSIQFYDQQIIILKSGKESVNQNENIKLLNNRAKDNKEAVLKTEGDIKKLKEEMQKLTNEAKEISGSEQVLYWQEQINEKRHVLGFFAWTVKKFNYDDIPFEHVLTASENASKFEAVEDKKNGKFKATYESNLYADGIASVQIFVKKKDKPDHKQRMKDIAQETQTKQEKFEKLQQVVGSLKKENDSLEQSVTLFQQSDQEYERKKMKQIEEWEVGKRKLLEKITSLENEIAKSTKELTQAEEIFKIKGHLYEIIAKIASIIDFDSSLVEEFIFQYTRLSSKIAKTSRNDEDVPSAYECAINGFIMDDPVTATCGHSFERVAIMKWIGDKEEKTCPCCRKLINKKDLISNISLKQLIDNWRNEKVLKRQSSSPSLGSKSAPFSFFKGTTPNVGDEILIKLFARKDELEIEIDKLQREYGRVVKQIETYTQLDSNLWAK